MNFEHCIVIVDPYSSGALLATALVQRNVTCIGVQSSATLPDDMKSKFDATNFRQLVVHRGCLETTLRQIERYQPFHVIAGFESGVELAEQLSSSLGLATNEMRQSSTRRDKSAMGEAVRQSGLRVAKQFCSEDVDALIAWREDVLDWPVIVKPIRSAASDHVRCCRSTDQLRQAAREILQGPNVFGESNTMVLAQEYLRGPEYAMDTVSRNGLHKLTAFWQYIRPASAASSTLHTARFVSYDGLRLLPYEGGVQDMLREYVFQVLDAVGVRIGPAHTEVILTSDGPVLVEVGARMSAGNNAVLSRQCGGPCQLDETVKCILEPEQFLEHIGQRATLQKYAANVFLMNRRHGRLVRTCHESQLRMLPTLESMSIVNEPGQMVGEVAGRITLLDADWDAIERDIATVRSLEQQGIFVIEEDAVT